jgi:hypothetical protein
MNTLEQDLKNTLKPAGAKSPTPLGDKPQGNPQLAEQPPRPTAWLVENARRLSQDPELLAKVEARLF